MNSKDENVDAYIMHGIPCTCSRVVQNIIVFENDLTALSLQEVQDIIMQFSTLLSGSEHYCRCTSGIVEMYRNWKYFYSEGNGHYS